MYFRCANQAAASDRDWADEHMLTANHTIPVRVLAGLSATVLMAHLVLLQNTTMTLGFGEPSGSRVFTTRTVRIEAVAPLPDGQANRAREAPARRGIPALARTPQNPAAVAAALAVDPTQPPKQVVPADVSSVAQASPTEPPAPSAPAASEAAPASAPAPASAMALPRDAALAARAYAVPGAVRLKFNVLGRRSAMDYSALGELLWLLRDDNSYEARMEVGAFLLGSRVLSSTGRMTADGLAPKRFSDKFRSELAAHFERDRGRVSFSANTPEAALLPGAQDQLSIFVQLAAMVAGAPEKYPSGTTITIQTVGPRSAEPWIFGIEESEKLQLPGGELTALRLSRNPRKEYDQKVEIWLAPSLGYLPARIRITQSNGDFIDQQWRSSAAP